MVIIHVVKVKNRPFCGVDVIVPKHIEEQQKKETVALLNLANVRCTGVKHQFEYNGDFNIDQIPEQFNHPDIVIFHQVYAPEYIKISKILRQKKIPYIIVPHGSLTTEAQKTKRIKKILGNILFSPFIKHAAAIQCLSEKEKVNTNIKVPKFIGTNGCIIPSRHKHSFTTNKTRFVYIGRLDCHIKGLDIMLDAFKLVKDSPYKDQFELRIYGPAYKGSYAFIHEMIAERALNDCVSVHSPVIADEKEQVLLESDVFIQTSRSEGMPMGILEALSYGLPCLITTGTTLGDLVKQHDSGWVADTNAQSVFENIVCVINENNTLSEKSKGAIKLISNHFTWDKVTYDNINAYRKYANLGEV